MRSTVVGLIVMSFLIGGMAQASPISTWGYWKADNNEFDNFFLTRPNVEWSGYDNNLITSPDEIPGRPDSGGEWFDVEHMFVDVVKRDDDETYLEWLLITSYTGLEPGEWAPTTEWTGGSTGAGTVTNGAGYGALRDNGLPKGGTSSWAYRQNPVLAFSIDSEFDWALVLDSDEVPNSYDPTTGYSGTPYDITTAAPALYKVTVTDQEKLVPWVAPDMLQFPLPARIADLDTRGWSPSNVWFGDDGDSKKSFASERFEEVDDQTDENGWNMKFNWYWTGSMKLSGANGPKSAGFDLEALTTDEFKDTNVQYAMWCGNDFILAKPGTGYSDKPTPELSSGVLLVLGALPVGLAWWRRRRGF